jgi:ketosteroid isomerase-like protein
MKKSLGVFSLVAVVTVGLLPSFAFGQASAPADPGAVAAITKLENDAVKADLASDASFYQKNLADDWTGGTSRGTSDTKTAVLADMKDTKNNKTASESIADLKVRTYGDVAIATYRSTYDATIKGEHFARTVLTTDTFLRQNGAWKQIASHSSQAAK